MKIHYFENNEEGIKQLKEFEKIGYSNKAMAIPFINNTKAKKIYKVICLKCKTKIYRRRLKGIIAWTDECPYCQRRMIVKIRASANDHNET
jgi:hypothetical protein